MNSFTSTSATNSVRWFSKWLGFYPLLDAEIGASDAQTDVSDAQTDVSKNLEGPIVILAIQLSKILSLKKYLGNQLRNINSQAKRLKRSLNSWTQYSFRKVHPML